MPAPPAVTLAAAHERAAPAADEEDRVSVSSSVLADKCLGSYYKEAGGSCLKEPVLEDDKQVVSQAYPRLPVRVRNVHINWLLAGESGLGKTTLAHQLLRSYITGGAQLHQGHNGTSTSMETFKSNPESLCSLLGPVMTEDGIHRLYIKVQDMPGWGDDINVRGYLETVMNFILQQREKDYQEWGGDRHGPKDSLLGTHRHSVTACLYFLPPDRIKQGTYAPGSRALASDLFVKHDWTDPSDRSQSRHDTQVQQPLLEDAWKHLQEDLNPSTKNKLLCEDNRTLCRGRK